MKNIITIAFMMLSALTSFITPLAADVQVEILAKMQTRPANPAVTPDGTVYISMHPFDNPKFKIMRLMNGKAMPYPNEEISSSYNHVIGIQATQDGTLWWLDMGGENISPKLVGWDTKMNRLKTIYTIPQEASVANSFHQDFAIDEKRGNAFIADMSRGGMIDESNPAIVVIDLKSGATRRVLSGNKLFQPGKNPVVAEGKPLKMKDKDGNVHYIRLGLNPIAVDPENEWVYFASVTAGNIYRVRAGILGDFSKSEGEIEKAIETYAYKPSSGGIAVGDNGKVYITNVDESAISIATSKGTKTWIKDDRIIWPDGLYIAPDKSVVVTINQLNRAPAFNGGIYGSKKPYLVMRLRDNQ